MEVELEWKNTNQEYLSALEKFLDKAENIKAENIKEEIIAAMLKCDNVLTQLAIKEINKNK